MFLFIFICIKISFKFIKYNKQYYPQNDYLLIDSKGYHLSNDQLNQRINDIFDGKKVGINNLRHQYLTDKFKDVNLKEMKAIAEAMGKLSRINFKINKMIKINKKYKPPQA